MAVQLRFGIIGIPFMTSQCMQHANLSEHTAFASFLKSNFTLIHFILLNIKKIHFIATATLSGLKLGLKASLISLNAPLTNRQKYESGKKNRVSSPYV